MIALKTASIFNPSFADIQGQFSASSPITSLISFFTSSMRAEGKSILLMIGIISRLLSRAR